ncbi:MAG: Uma2 family endonuclease [Burkholderiales bacterium]
MGRPQRQSLEEREYLARETVATERHEYVAGVAHAMAGAGERHNRIAGNLFAALRSAARGTGCGVYISDMKLRVGAGRAYYYPDVMLSCEPATPEAVFKDAPCFVAEVLSPTTAAIDTREKLQAYGAIESLRYYLLVDSERASVRYRVRGSDGEWLGATLDPGERIEIQCGPVRAGFGLSEIYEDSGLATA